MGIGVVVYKTYRKEHVVKVTGKHIEHFLWSTLAIHTIRAVGHTTRAIGTPLTHFITTPFGEFTHIKLAGTLSTGRVGIHLTIDQGIRRLVRSSGVLVIGYGTVILIENIQIILVIDVIV